MKKYIYPIAFALAQVPFYLFLGWIVTQVGTDSRAARMVVFGGLALWMFLLIPVFCIRYSALIQKEKAKIGFAVYNCVVLALMNTSVSDSVVRMLLSFVLVGAWVTLCTFAVPMLHALVRARAMKVLEKEEKKKP